MGPPYSFVFGKFELYMQSKWAQHVVSLPFPLTSPVPSLIIKHKCGKY